MQKYINLLKKHKKRLLVIFGFIIFTWFLVYSERLINDPNRIQTPKIVTQDVSTKKSLQLISTLPEEGVQSTFDTFELVVFEFSDNIDPDTLDLSVSPKIEVKVIHSKDEPNKIILLPLDNGWLPNVRYTITLIDLKSPTGVALAKAARYVYHNEPPPVVDFIFPY